MNKGTWYICCSGKDNAAFAQAAGAFFGCNRVVLGEDAQTLRCILKKDITGCAHVVVGPYQTEIDPINLAAGLVKDGVAQSVYLVCEEVSGSVTSRAKQAGIEGVFALDEFMRLLVPKEKPVTALKAEEQKPALTVPVFAQKEARSYAADFDNLDEPDGISKPVHVTRKKNGAPIIALTSGRGGVGKTTLAALWACLAYSWGMKVALVDLDLCCGNLYAYFGQTKPSDLASVCKLSQFNSEAFMRAGAPLDADKSICLWGPCQLPEEAELVDSYIADMLATLSNTFDIVLVDMPNSWSDTQAQAAQMCDRLCVVTDQRTGAVAALTKMHGLASRLCVIRTRIIHILNRCDRLGKDEAFLSKIHIDIANPSSFYIEDGGYKVSELASAGKIVDVAKTKTAFVSSAALALAKILEELGHLPANDAAKNALRVQVAKKQGLLGHLKRQS